MAKQKSILINCSCGCNEFKIVDEKIVCSHCDKEIKDEKVCFLNSTDKQLPIDIAKFAIESAAIGGGVLVGMSIPFALPFAFTALGAVSQKAGEWLGELFESKMYDEGTYGKKLAKKFDSAFDKIYKKNINDDNGKYQNFRNYSDYCRRHYMEVLSLLIEKKLSADVFSEEAIKAIISEENHYPGAENDQILGNVLFVSKELKREYETQIQNDRGLYDSWLVEKRTNILEGKIDELQADVKRLIEYSVSQFKESRLTDAEFEYIKIYNRPLFLEDDSDISLNKVYVDPIVEGTDCSITNEIYEWHERGDEKILIVKGAAGIGKTSLVSRIIADTYGHSDFKNDLKKENLFPIILRSNIEAFENASSNKTPIAIIKDILDVRSEDIQNSLIILDGFDELCLLAENFNPDLFLEKLSRDLKSKNTKVLITSRLMNEIKEDIQNVEIKSIVWEKEQIIAWCEKFRDASEKDSEKQWCDEFIANYDDLAQNDSDGNKMDIFQAPMILYLACHSDSKISVNETIGELYDDVFRKIASRKHIENDEDCSVFMDNENDEKANLINWQFTKELAYQMFLHDTLILSDSEFIKNAKNRTAEVLVNRGIIADKKDLNINKLKYLAVTHFAKETINEMGIEFAHKTVYEYFTAVKLYEDYFAEITEDFPKLQNDNKMLEKVWTNIIEAFRYKKIDKSIFTYLNKMTRPVYNGKAKDEGKGFDFKMFVKCFVEGMEQKILADLEIKSRVKGYAVNSALLTTQISLAFRNLTWFLSERDNSFHNVTDNETCKDLYEIIQVICGSLNLKNWKLSRANLNEANMKYANLSGADLRCAYLNGANLRCANLSRADLSEAHLIEAKLSGAGLSEANLNKADLREADLSGADLSGANLSETYLIEVNLSRTNLSGAKLSGACLYEADLLNADLRQADLLNADLRRADLINADLSKAYLRGANLSEAHLIEAKLSGADLIGAYLSEANLSEAKLSGAELYRAILQQADLSGVDLCFSNLSEADLSGAKLSEVCLSKANLSRADLIGAKLSGADLSGADLCFTNLSEANLSGAKLIGSYLIETNLSGADLRGTNLRGAYLYGADLSEAKYCLDLECETKFPDVFNPEEHGMIEVDILGNPVK